MTPIKSDTAPDVNPKDTPDEPDGEAVPLEGPGLDVTTNNVDIRESSLEMMTSNAIYRYRQSLPDAKPMEMDGDGAHRMQSAPQQRSALMNDDAPPPPPPNQAWGNTGNANQYNTVGTYSNTGYTGALMGQGAHFAPQQDSQEFYDANQSWPRYNAMMNPMQMYQPDANALPPNNNPNMGYNYSSPQGQQNTFTFQQQQQQQQQYYPAQAQAEVETPVDARDSSSGTGSSGTEESDSGMVTGTSGSSSEEEPAPDEDDVGRRISAIAPTGDKTATLSGL
eukprot:303048_1